MTIQPLITDKDIRLDFEGEFITTLHDLIVDNNDEDCIPVCAEEAAQARLLKIGQSTYVGMILVTRISNALHPHAQLDCMGFTKHNKWFIHEHLEIMIMKHTEHSLLMEEWCIDIGKGIDHVGSFDECLKIAKKIIDEAFAPNLIHALEAAISDLREKQSPELTPEEIDLMQQHHQDALDAQDEIDAMRHGDNLDHQIEIHNRSFWSSRGESCQ